MRSRTFVTKFDNDGPWSGADIYWTPNGHLSCDECHKYWCEHIQLILEENRDANVLWEEFHNDPQSGISLEIPMSPSHNQWAQILLLNADMSSACMTVNYVSSSFNKKLTTDNFIGYLHPSEGRMVIRSMMFDWFRGHIVTPTATFRCSSGSHKYKEEMIWRTDMLVERIKLIEYWSVYVSGYCLACNGGDSFDDDLIPDGEKKESVW